MNFTGLLDKEPRNFTFDEAYKFTDLLFQYLKHDGVSDPYSEDKRSVRLTSGHIIQHVNYLQITEFEGKPIGFQDEIVYVGRSVPENDKVFMGMNWKDDPVNRANIIRLISKDDLNTIFLSVSAHIALSKINKRK